MIKILIACGSTFTRLGLRNMFSTQKDLYMVDEATSLKAIIHSCKTKKPEIIMICAQMLFKSRTNIISQIKKEAISANIVIFNSNLSPEQELSFVKQGFVGIFHFDCSSSELVTGMRKIHKGELWLRRDLIKLLVDSKQEGEKPENSLKGHSGSLTKKEMEILSKIAEGCKNSEIAAKLYISESTVKTHINNLYRKLGVTDRFQAILYALKYNHV